MVPKGQWAPVPLQAGSCEKAREESKEDKGQPGTEPGSHGPITQPPPTAPLLLATPLGSLVHLCYPDPLKV